MTLHQQVHEKSSEIDGNEDSHLDGLSYQHSHEHKVLFKVLYIHCSWIGIECPICLVLKEESIRITGHQLEYLRDELFEQSSTIDAWLFSSIWSDEHYLVLSSKVRTQADHALESALVDGFSPDHNRTFIEAMHVIVIILHGDDHLQIEYPCPVIKIYHEGRIPHHLTV